MDPLFPGVLPSRSSGLLPPSQPTSASVSHQENGRTGMTSFYLHPHLENQFGADWGFDFVFIEIYFEHSCPPNSCGEDDTP